MSDIEYLLLRDSSKLKSTSLNSLKRAWAVELGKGILRDSDVLTAYKSLIRSGNLSPSPSLERKLITRRVRSLSGVTPFAVMTKPYICPGLCTFCPLEAGMPKSYLSDEPAAQRAKLLNFDPRLQIENRLEQLVATGHTTNKIELIVIGGTFSNYPEEYKREFFKGMFDAVNGANSATLEEAQVANESAPRRIVSISIETRPDWIDRKEVRLLRELGVTKLQVGVQAFDETILKRIKRGHGLKEVEDATRLLRDSGFKICYHFMPNLPGSTPELDLAMARLMYEDPRFKPDFVKIYPAQVIPRTQLYREWKRGEFKTYSDRIMINLLKQIKLATPSWVRIDRLVRDISKKWVASGTHHSNMRQMIQDELKKEGKSCQCIRCREIKGRQFQENPKLVDRKIETVGGVEHFISFERENHLYSLLRLRLPYGELEPIFPELKGAALVREIHTFGVPVPVDGRDLTKTQHQGLGKKLLARAAKIAKDHGFRKLAVISAVGTRNYYRKLGFALEGLYMTKQLE